MGRLSLLLTLGFALTLTATAAANAAPGDTLYIQSDNVNVYEAPSVDAPVLMQLDQGQKLKEFRRQGGWVKVIIYGEIGKDGWVEQSHLGSKPRADAYRGPEDQFVINLPQGWTIYDQNKAVYGQSSPFGMLIISSANLERMDLNSQLESMAKMDIGELPSLLVDRLPAKKNMTCLGFSAGAKRKVLELLKGDVMFSKGAKILKKLKADIVLVGGCKGLRIRGETQVSNGNQWVLDVHAVSDGKVLYLFYLRSLKKYYVKNLRIYEKMISTVKLKLA